ncbi:carbonic anhydrase [Glycocaulis sp.]
MISDLMDANLEQVTQWRRKHPQGSLLPVQEMPPDTLWITATDSPLSPAMLTGLDAGRFTVLRTPGALITSSDLACLAVLDMALGHVQVRRIVVCGHYGCSAMAHICEGDGGDVSPTALWLAPAREAAMRHEAELKLIGGMQARANRLGDLVVAAQVRALATNPLVADVWRRRRSLTLHGLVYSLHDGLLREVCDPVSGPKQARVLVGGAA